MMSVLMRKLIRVSGILMVVVTTAAFVIEANAQIEINIFDFDGTLVENRQSRDGSFNSKILIYRNDQRLNLLQEQAAGPKVVTISQQDLHRIGEHLASGEGRPGSVGREVELQDGTRIRPGDYYLRYPDSYEYFREATDGRNHLLESFKEAEARSPIQWKGPAWEAFEELCKTAEGARSISILTARGHSAAEWQALFDYWAEKGLIKFKPATKYVYAMSRPEFDRFGGGGGAVGGDSSDVSSRKSGLIEEILIKLGRVDLPPGLLHNVRFFEDEVRNLNRVAAVFQKIAFGNHVPVRMTLVNTGLKTEIRASSRPEISYIEPQSSVFKSLPKENVLTGPGNRATSVVIRTCQSLFQGVAQ